MALNVGHYASTLATPVSNGLQLEASVKQLFGDDGLSGWLTTKFFYLAIDLGAVDTLSSA